MAEVDLINRDPNSINDHLSVSVRQLLQTDELGFCLKKQYIYEVKNINNLLAFTNSFFLL